MLMVLQRNDGASPAELCEYMDVRPSSMSELLSRMEENGLICRESNENDKRATRVHLSESGAEAAGRIADRFREDNEKFASCFTEAEREQFCLLCDRLSAHLESMNEGKPCGGCHRHHGHHHGPHGPHGHHRPPEFAD